MNFRYHEHKQKEKDCFFDVLVLPPDLADIAYTDCNLIDSSIVLNMHLLVSFSPSSYIIIFKNPQAFA